MPRGRQAAKKSARTYKRRRVESWGIYVYKVLK